MFKDQQGFVRLLAYLLNNFIFIATFSQTYKFQSNNSTNSILLFSYCHISSFDKFVLLLIYQLISLSCFTNLVSFTRVQSNLFLFTFIEINSSLYERWRRGIDRMVLDHQRAFEF